MYRQALIQTELNYQLLRFNLSGKNKTPFQVLYNIYWHKKTTFAIQPSPLSFESANSRMQNTVRTIIFGFTKFTPTKAPGSRIWDVILRSIKLTTSYSQAWQLGGKP